MGGVKSGSLQLEPVVTLSQLLQPMLQRSHGKIGQPDQTALESEILSHETLRHSPVVESAQSGDELTPIGITEAQKAVGNIDGEIEASVVEDGLGAMVELEGVVEVVAMGALGTDEAVAAGDYAGVGDTGDPACMGFCCVELEELGDARTYGIGGAGWGGGIRGGRLGGWGVNGGVWGVRTEAFGGTWVFDDRKVVDHLMG